MSRISENIRKITKSWGGKTTGNGISDALSDLYNNLPFGVKTEMVEIVPETTINIVNGDCDIDGSIEIIGGNSYTVKWNGTEYECIAQAMSVDGEEHYFIGNTGFLDMDNTGEPFLICKIVTSEGAMAQVIAGDSLSSSVNTMSIVGVKETIKKIDKKYLPDDIGGSEPIIFTTMDFATVTCNKSFAECIQAFNNGNFQAYLFLDVEKNRRAVPFATIAEGDMLDSHGSYIRLSYSISLSGAEIVVNYSEYELQIIAHE